MNRSNFQQGTCCVNDEYHSVLYIYSASTTYCRFKWMVIGSVWCIVTDNVLWHWWTTTISPIKRFNVIRPLTFRVWTGSPTISTDWRSNRMFHVNCGNPWTEHVLSEANLLSDYRRTTVMTLYPQWFFLNCYGHRQLLDPFYWYHVLFLRQE